MREDQAAAALSVLADSRRVSVLNAPAGAGKTRVLAEIAKAWQGAGFGPVIGITASQSARNTLAAGGSSPTTAPGSSATSPAGAQGATCRSQRNPPGHRRGVNDDDPDLADLITLAERHQGKVIAAGDTEQLQAVQGGGGMSLLADRLG